MPYYKLFFCFILFNIINTRELGAQDSINDSWLGWRGQNYGSVELVSPPIEWGIHNNIVWKSSIDGEGHSSPVSDGRFVYISSSSTDSSARMLENIFMVLEIFLVIVLIYRTISSYSNNVKQNNLNIVYYGLSLTILIIVLFILVLGNGYFNYERCNLRVWFITVIIYTLLVTFLLINLLVNKLNANKYVFYFVLTFPVLLFIIMPSKSHAFRGGLFHIASLTTILALVIPYIIHLFLIAQSGSDGNIVKKATGTINPELLKKIQHILPVGFVFFTISIMAIYIISPTEESENIRYRTFISTSLSIILAFLTLLLIAVYKNSTKKRLVVLTIIVVLSNIILLSILEKLFSQISYFRYHLGNQKISLISDDFTFHIGYIPFIISLSVLGYFLNRKYKSIKICSVIPIVIITLFMIQYFLINKNVIHERNVLCYDIRTGKEIWRNSSIKDVKSDLHDQNTFATPTPVIIGDFIMSYFGSSGLICINRLSGKTEWINKELKISSFYGAASSPVGHDDKVYLLHGDLNKQLITSVNYKTGKTIWQNSFKAKEMIYRSPLIRQTASECSIICISGNSILVFNENDGETKYSLEFENIEGDPVSSIIPDSTNHDIIYVSGRSYTMAINLGRLSEKRFIDWRTKTIGANCASPVMYKDFLFTISDNGILSCLNNRNGRVVYKKKLPGYYYSSLCRAGKYLYATNLDGETSVLEILPDKFVEKSVNRLEEKVYASLAFVNNKLICRTLSSLVLIEK